MSETGTKNRDHRGDKVRRIGRRRRVPAATYSGRRAALSAASLVVLAESCSFDGAVSFSRAGHSRVAVRSDCVFAITCCSDEVGVSRPCTLSALEADAELVVGDHCRTSGSVVAVLESVVLGHDVLCGANVVTIGPASVVATESAVAGSASPRVVVAACPTVVVFEAGPTFPSCRS